ncbi:MAG: 4-hydroxy-3-methylbut-2-enyl diphosphate reductase [Bacteroidales bacterium]|nr:4-hydroxy-3-methylbut-2-enyl diphosphate reductase [Bacteroidales bacterium]
MKIEIDKDAGFCFGVSHAIKMAEEYLKDHSYLYCLGDIVHNKSEVKRLSDLGLRIIDYSIFRQLKDETVLIRAHGEPVETYKIASQNNIDLIEGTCPIVTRLQKMIREEASENQPQVVIFGKKNHPEAIGLASRVSSNVQITQNTEELELDYCKPVYVYSQTTMDKELYEVFYLHIQERAEHECSNPHVRVQDSVCGKVANRAKQIRDFVGHHDVVIFVSGANSSNGNYLFQVARKVNPNTYFVSDVDQLNSDWLKQAESVGISGATSTPVWLMEKVKARISQMD